ncbi:MAG: CARDB domain-containing protein [Candidatus Micrarchaeota archaeon]
MNKSIAFFVCAVFIFSLLPFAYATTPTPTISPSPTVIESGTATSGGIGGTAILIKSYSYTVNFKQGWNLFSVPLTNSRIISTDCVKKPIYYYNTGQNQYYSQGGFAVGTELLGGFGYWYKSDYNCKATFMGSGHYALPFGMELGAGWNQIGAPYDTINFKEMAGNCDVVSGPYKFNTAAYKWEKAEMLQKGEGYFIKVRNACALSAQPPNPPESLPDLTISELPSMPSPNAGDTISLKYIVKNIGPGKAGSSVLKIGGNTGGLYSVPSLGAGEQYAAYHKFIVPSSQVQIIVTVDSNNQVEESNENNNQFVQYLYVGNNTQKGFDPGIVEISLSNSNPKAGEAFTINIPVKNYGDVGGYITSFSLGLTGGGEGNNLGGGFGMAEGGNRYLGPGETYIYQANSQVLPTGGMWTATATISATNDINAGNNVYKRTLYVAPASTGFDLGIYVISISPLSPKVGDTITVTAYLYNYGDTGGYLKGHSFSISGPTGAQGGSATSPVSGTYIGGHQYYTLSSTFSNTFNAAGSWNVKASISPEGDINSANNQLDKQFAVSESPTNCEYYGDGSRSGMKINCKWHANNGYIVQLKDVSSFAPQRAQFDVLTSAGSLVKRVYLGTGESTVVTEAGNLYLYVNNMAFYQPATNSYVDLTIKSNYQQNTGFDLGVYSISISPQQPKVGESVTITANLYNYGDTGGYLKGHSFNFEGPQSSMGGGGGSAPISGGTGIYIASHQYYTITSTFANTFNTAGNWKVKVTINPENDYNSANNLMDKTFYVEAQGTNTTPSPSISPTPSITATPFTPQFFDLYIRNSYWASPSLISLFNPADRWRFVGTQQLASSGSYVSIAGMEDSINFDRDYNDMAFDVTSVNDVKRVSVKINSCNSAAADAVWVKYLQPGNSTAMIMETNEYVIGEYPEIMVFPQCSGNEGKSRSVWIYGAA